MHRKSSRRLSNIPMSRKASIVGKKEIVTIESSAVRNGKQTNLRSDLQAGFWPLFEECCSSQDWESKTQLLRSYSLPQCINMQNHVGNTMLMLAVQYNRLQVIQLLCAIKADFYVVNHKGWTVAHIAIAYRQVAALRLLRKLGMCLSIKNEHSGAVPAHFVARDNNVTMLKEFVALQVQLDATTNTGYTILHTAAESDAFEMVQYILQHNIIHVNAQDKIGETAAHKAARAGHTKVLTELGKYKANFQLRNIEDDSVEDLSNDAGHFQLS